MAVSCICRSEDDCCGNFDTSLNRRMEIASPNLKTVNISPFGSFSHGIWQDEWWNSPLPSFRQYVYQILPNDIDHTPEDSAPACLRFYWYIIYYSIKIQIWLPWIAMVNTIVSSRIPIEYSSLEVDEAGRDNRQPWLLMYFILFFIMNIMYFDEI